MELEDLNSKNFNLQTINHTNSTKVTGHPMPLTKPAPAVIPAYIKEYVS